MARHLLLVRHSLSSMTPDVPASRWGLSEEGRRRCEPLAARLAAYSPSLVASSPEPKALETATLVMERLRPLWHRSLTCAAPEIEIVDGLREHVRETLPWLSQEDFDARLRAFFARPDVLVIGEETAAEALLRFTRAVTVLTHAAEPTASAKAAAVRRSPARRRKVGPTTGDVFIFTHSTVMTLFVSACSGQDAFSLWQRLGMPSFVVLVLPELVVEGTVAEIG